MIMKNSQLYTQDKNIKDLDNTSSNYSSFDEIMTKQNIASKKVNTVHRRRDLDSLG